MTNERETCLPVAPDEPATAGADGPDPGAVVVDTDAQSAAHPPAGRHAAGTSRRVVPGMTALAVVLVLAGGTGALSSPGSAATPPARHVAVDRSDPTTSTISPAAFSNGALAATFASDVPSHRTLAKATAPPEPAPPRLAFAPSLRPHEVFGFAPYWTLPDQAGFDVSQLSTLAYFALDVNADGSIVESGAAWEGYQSQDLADLITRSHEAGDRVVLTAGCFAQSVLDELTSDPTAWHRLATGLVALVRAKRMDGVNIDFEGAGPADQVGLSGLMTVVSATLRHADPHWQITMDTYASSAGDPGGFYDIGTLARSVDAFFVMAYQMGSPTTPTALDARSGAGYFATDTVAQEYTAVVPPSQVILGLPYYGYDWPTAGPGLGDPATGPAEPVTYAQIVAQRHPVYWDGTTDTAWTSYLVGSQWHQTWYDDPTALALKTELADQYGLRGVGIWALGMDGDDPTMLAALTGSAPVAKDYTPGPGPTVTSPTSSTSSTEPGSTSTSSTEPGSSTTLPGGSTTTTAPGGSTTTTTSLGGTTTTTAPGGSTTTSTSTSTTIVAPTTTTTFGSSVRRRASSGGGQPLDDLDAWL